jgi:predicted permease
MERDIARELSFHVTEREDQLRAEGLRPDEAARRARLQLGNVLGQAERTRDADVAAWLDQLLRDTRLAVRALARTPGFTATVLLTLAIGIGATTSIFSVVNGVLIQPLPFSRPDRLIALVHQAPGSPGPGNTDLAASPAIYFTYRDHSSTFSSVALWWSSTDTITGSGTPEEVQSIHVTHEFLPTLGVQPALGRTFSESDDIPGSPGGVILSYGYWQRRFGGLRVAVGKTLVVGGRSRPVIGVLPQGFRFLQKPADILIPLQPNRAIAVVGPIGEQGIARLKDGVTLAEANADAERMLRIMTATFPFVRGMSPEMFKAARFGPNLTSLKERVVGDLDDVLWVLMGTIGMLLLVACANVANLQLVRTEGRRQELAIKAALGAGRATIARSLLVEGTLLGLAGGAAGMSLAWLSLPLLLRAAASHLPSALGVTIDPTVLLFALAISIISGVLLGVVPVAKYGAARAAAALQGAGRGHGPTRDRNGVRNSLLVAQVALALVLLVASGLMIRTFQALRHVEPGFSAPERIQTVRISIPQGSVPEFTRVIQMQHDIQGRLAAIAGVESAGFASWLPLSGGGPSGPFFIEHKTLAPGSSPPETEFRFASPDFFEALGTPLLAGRAFDWTDHTDSRQVVVISEGMARAEWGTPEAAVGKRIRRTPFSSWLEVIGVVGDVHHDGLEQEAPDTVYLTLAESLAPYMSRTVSFVIRSQRVGTAGFLRDVQDAIWSVNGNLPLGSVQTMGDLYGQSMARTSLTLTLLGITGAMALLLGLVGIYGMIGYVVSQRASDIGIRMALGASNAALQRMFLRQGLLLVAAGVALGLGGAVTLSRLMETLLFGVTPLDLSTYAGVSALLLVAASLAIYLPVRRVVRFDPMQLCLRDGA